MRFSKLLVVVASVVFGMRLVEVERAWSQKAAREQCSLASITNMAGKGAVVCDLATVKRLAQRGHAYEQNQLGIASILAIGPDYSDKDALEWFKRAAQRGYAPAEVNLAVMYVNGWGTPVNYGEALQWLRSAADQHYGRAYYNLGILFREGKGVKQDNDEAYRWFKKR